MVKFSHFVALMCISNKFRIQMTFDLILSALQQPRFEQFLITLMLMTSARCEWPIWEFGDRFNALKKIMNIMILSATLSNCHHIKVISITLSPASLWSNVGCLSPTSRNCLQNIYSSVRDFRRRSERWLSTKSLERQIFSRWQCFLELKSRVQPNLEG